MPRSLCTHPRVKSIYVINIHCQKDWRQYIKMYIFKWENKGNYDKFFKRLCHSFRENSKRWKNTNSKGWPTPLASLYNRHLEAGETMAQQFRPHTVPAEDQSSGSCTHVWWLTTARKCSSRGSNASGLQRHLHKCGIQKQRHTHIHTYT